MFTVDDFFSSQQTIQHKLAYEWIPNLCESILEVGCSSGYFTRCLTSKAKEVYGIDVNGEHINIAKMKYPNVNFLVSDAGNLPFVDEMFDVVVMLEVFEHVEDKEKAIREIHRVLKSDGKLILSTPNTGMFTFLDPFNLKITFKKLFPSFTKTISTKIQKYKNTQYRDNLIRHGHYSLEFLQKYFKGTLAIEKVHRGGLIVFPLCSLLQSILIRVIPVKFLFAIMQKLMNLDGSIRYGKWAYNLVVQTRKI